MSIFQMALMGGSALGAGLWGYLAEHTSVTTAVIAGSVVGIISVLFSNHLKLEGGSEEDLTPVCPIEHPMPDRDIDHDVGPVMISVEYQIDPKQMFEFQIVMKKARDARLRQGAVSWSFFEDAEQEGKCLEYFIFETWADYLRRFDRFTTNDLNLQEERFAFHLGNKPPIVTRRVAAPLHQ
jgi:hypothetical protein